MRVNPGRAIDLDDVNEPRVIALACAEGQNAPVARAGRLDEALASRRVAIDHGGASSLES